MKRIARWLALFILIGTPLSHASDHGDGTSTGAAALALEPAADVNDLFAWMSASATQVNLAISVFPGATTTSRFSDAVKYVFHTTSAASYLANTVVSRDIVCMFSNATPQAASCWLTDPADTTAAGIKEFVTGNASATTGITSTDAKVRVFAGPRADPFFVNLVGFRNATATVAAALKEAGPTAMGTYIKGLDTGGHPGCPILTKTARDVVRGYLNHDCTGIGTAIDFFKKPVPDENSGCTVKPALVNTQQTQNSGLTGNILALVVQVDKTLLTTGGSVLNVWAATTK